MLSGNQRLQSNIGTAVSLYAMTKDHGHLLSRRQIPDELSVYHAIDTFIRSGEWRDALCEQL